MATHTKWSTPRTAAFAISNGTKLCDPRPTPGKCWVRNPWRDGFKHAPIPESARKALVDMELYRTPPRREDWGPWLDSMTYQQFLTDVMGIEAANLAEVLKYLNPVTCAMGCGLGADVISAYSAYNFLQPGVNGY